MKQFFSRITTFTMFCFIVLSSRADSVKFRDVTVQAGINNTAKATCVALADYDDDGCLDIYVGNSGTSGSPIGRPNVLYRNNGDGTFTDVSASMGVADVRPTKGASFGDFDNDGKCDLYIANDFALNALYVNRYPWKFEDITERAGVIGWIDKVDGKDIPNGYGVTLADIDNDGFLDIYVVNLGAQNMVYRNNGNQTFTDITSELDLYGGQGLQSASTCAVFSDYNCDGNIDLLALNGYGLPSFFYVNKGGCFEEHVLDGFKDAQCAVFGDYDNDGDMDLFVTNCATAEGVPLANALYRNDKGKFVDVTSEANLTDEDYSLGTCFGDVDNDGWLDILVVNNGSSPRLYQNNRNGTFTDITEKAGLLRESLGSCAALGDFNNDGYLDIYLANAGLPNEDEGEPDILYINEGGTNHWLQVQLTARISNRMSIGARIKVKSGNLIQVREITSSGGYVQDSPIANFGLGSSTIAEMVEVSWPSGIIQRLYNVKADQRILIEETPSSVDENINNLPLTWGGVKDHRDEPMTLLGQNYPNPFNPETWIPYRLPRSSHVMIAIYNSNGQLVREFDLGRREAGSYFSKDKAVYWDGTDARGEKLPSGIYFYQLLTDEFSAIKKMILLR